MEDDAIANSAGVPVLGNATNEACLKKISSVVSVVSSLTQAPVAVSFCRQPITCLCTVTTSVPLGRLCCLAWLVLIPGGSQPTEQFTSPLVARRADARIQLVLKASFERNAPEERRKRGRQGRQN